MSANIKRMKKFVSWLKKHPIFVGISILATVLSILNGILGLSDNLKKALGIPECWRAADVYVHPSGRFERVTGVKWVEHPPYAEGKHFTFKEFDRDHEYIYLIDESRRKDPGRVMYFRIPICGGMTQWSFPNPLNWTDVHKVKRDDP